MAQLSTPEAPFALAATMLPFFDSLAARGAPVASWQAEAGLDARELSIPDSRLPLHACYRFLELAEERSGERRLALEAAEEANVLVFGELGGSLLQTTNLLEYLHFGSLQVPKASSGTRIWLSCEGRDIRVSCRVASGRGEGPAVAEIYTLAITVMTVRRLLGSADTIGRVTLRAGLHGYAAALGAHLGVRVICGGATTALDIPMQLLNRPIAWEQGQGQGQGESGGKQAASDPEGVRIVSMATALIDLLLEDRAADLSHVAECLEMSPRTLQRKLSACGRSFGELSQACRMRRAREKLREERCSVSEVAAALGYTDSSNFARAFSRETGMAPLAYRRMVREFA